MGIGFVRTRALSILLSAAAVTFAPVAAFAQVVPSAGFQDAVALSSLLTTLNSGVFSQGQSFTSVPPDAKPDQAGRGVWVRGNAGLFDVKSLGVLTSGVNGVIPTFTRTTYGSVQAGIDLGKFNLGGSGLNVVYGVTGGDVTVDGTVTNSSVRAGFDIPFVGTYVVVSKGGFVAEASYRHDFITSQVTDPFSNLIVPSLEGHSDTGSFTAAYKYRLPSRFFVEGSGSFFVSQTSIGSFFVPGNPGTNTPAQLSGTARIDPLRSDLGRLGLRIGDSFSMAGISLEPFFAFSVWNEFAGPNGSNFTSTSGGVFTAVSTRVGTFEQYSVGVSASLQKDLLLFVRGDVRSGNNLTGNNISGGLRLNF